jgi:hypothetical protein
MLLRIFDVSFRGGRERDHLWRRRGCIENVPIRSGAHRESAPARKRGSSIRAENSMRRFVGLGLPVRAFVAACAMFRIEATPRSGAHLCD